MWVLKDALRNVPCFIFPHLRRSTLNMCHCHTATHISVATSVGAKRVPLAHSTLTNIRISWSLNSRFILPLRSAQNEHPMNFYIISRKGRRHKNVKLFLREHIAASNFWTCVALIMFHVKQSIDFKYIRYLKILQYFAFSCAERLFIICLHQI